MENAAPEYEPRYLAGIVLFNRGDYFEAHEVWEELWGDTAGTGRTFYQGLIQAAVGLCHFCNGNVRGAVKLYRTSRVYLEPYGPWHLGLEVSAFFQQLERCFAPLLQPENAGQRIEPEEDDLPVITLDPTPPVWPNPEDFLEAEGH